MKKQIVCPVCDGKGFVSWINNTEDTCSTGSKTCPHCSGTGLREEDMTNADNIRSMTDEELATFLSEVEYRRSIAGGGAIWFDDEGAMNWLKQPYKEGE